MNNRTVQEILERSLKAERKRVLTDDLPTLVEHEWKMQILERCIAALAVVTDEQVEPLMKLFNEAREEVYNGNRESSGNTQESS